jgi:hypothetical protein
VIGSYTAESYCRSYTVATSGVNHLPRQICHNRLSRKKLQQNLLHTISTEVSSLATHKTCRALRQPISYPIRCFVTRAKTSKTRQFAVIDRSTGIGSHTSESYYCSYKVAISCVNRCVSWICHIRLSRKKLQEKASHMISKEFSSLATHNTRSKCFRSTTNAQKASRDCREKSCWRGRSPCARADQFTVSAGTRAIYVQLSRAIHTILTLLLLVSTCRVRIGYI